MTKPRILVITLATLLGAVALPMSAGSPAGVDTASLPQAATPFVASWRLASFEARTATGQVIYPFGADARGVLTYTRDGRMWAVVYRANRAPFAVGDQQKGTASEYTAAVQSYIQYLGTYTVDRAAGTITHHVEQSIFPNWNDTDQVRYYRFDDNGTTLDLSAPPIQFGGTTIVAHLIWQRIADAR